MTIEELTAAGLPKKIWHKEYGEMKLWILPDIDMDGDVIGDEVVYLTNSSNVPYTNNFSGITVYKSHIVLGSKTEALEWYAKNIFDNTIKQHN